jgi:hypothetical protein
MRCDRAATVHRGPAASRLARSPGGNGHGNVSVRVPAADEMYFTSATGLRGLTPDGIARVRFDGTLLESHGVLVFHRTPELAIGGPVLIPGPMRAAALQRATAMEASGTRSAGTGPTMPVRRR